MKQINGSKRIDIQYKEFPDGGYVVGIYEDSALQITLFLVQKSFVFATVLQQSPGLSHEVLAAVGIVITKKDLCHA
jgi:hypothetical protein